MEMKDEIKILRNLCYFFNETSFLFKIWWQSVKRYIIVKFEFGSWRRIFFWGGGNFTQLMLLSLLSSGGVNDCGRIISSDEEEIKSKSQVQ